MGSGLLRLETTRVGSHCACQAYQSMSNSLNQSADATRLGSLRYSRLARKICMDQACINYTDRAHRLRVVEICEDTRVLRSPVRGDQSQPGVSRVRSDPADLSCLGSTKSVVQLARTCQKKLRVLHPKARMGEGKVKFNDRLRHVTKAHRRICACA